MSQQSAGTKTRILDVAERLFAERGFDAPSLRTITAAANVNLASIHYHFGSKEALVREVLLRRIGPLNAERLRLLDESERKANGAPVPLGEILEAFVRPVMKLWAEDPRRLPDAVRLIARLHVEQGERSRGLLKELFLDTGQRFLRALECALPWLPTRELHSRAVFCIGAMALSVLAHGSFQAMLGSGMEVSEPESFEQQLVTFLAAGLQTPAYRSGGPTEGGDEAQALLATQ